MMRFLLLGALLLVPAIAAAMPPNEPDQLYALCRSSDGRHVATGGNDASIRVFDIAARRLVRAIDAHQGSVWALAFSPDGKLLASGGGDGTIRLWSLPHGLSRGTLSRPRSKPSWLAFSPDGRHLAGCWDGAVHLIDMQTRRTRTLPIGRNLTQARYSPDGKLLVASGGGAGEGVVVTWDVARRRKLHEMKMSWAVFSADVSRASRIVGGSGSGDIDVWDGTTGNLLQHMRGDDANIYSVAISPDGTRVVTCGDRGSRLWDVAAAKVTAVSKYGGSMATFQPDGKHVVLSGDDREICVWDVETGVETKIH